MAYVQRIVVPVTTDGAGAATVYSDAISGLLSQVRYVKDGTTPFDNGVGVTITAEATGETLWAEAAVNASATRAPRQAIHTTSGVAVGATLVDKIGLADDRIKIVIAAGGATKTGAFHFLLE